MKKTFGTLTALLCSTLLLASCSPTESTEASAATAEGEVLKIAIEAQSAPFCWTQTDDSNGAIPLHGADTYTNGFDVKMIDRICEEAGIEWEAHKIDWDGMLLGVQTGTYDAAISGISITEERKATMLFTDPYYVADVVVLTRADSTFAEATTLSELSGGSTTSMMNTIWYDMCSQIPEAEVKPALDNVASMVVAVDSGAVDFVTCDVPTAVSIMQSNPDLLMIDPDDSDTFEVSDEDVNLGIAVAMGNEDIVEKFNAALATITEEEKAALLEEAVATQPLAQ